VNTIAGRRGRRLGWTSIDNQPCDGCGKVCECVILHVGGDGAEPHCPIAALCRACLVAALGVTTSRWDDLPNFSSKTTDKTDKGRADAPSR
jgi:hypothetical protein